MKVLIKGGYLIPMVGSTEIVVDGAVLIEGDRIAAVGATRQRRRPGR